MDEPRQYNTEHNFYMDDIELNATLCLHKKSLWMIFLYKWVEVKKHIAYNTACK